MVRKLCYIIMCHNDPEHLGRLIRALDDAADFIVHVDARSDIRPFQRAAPQANVRWVANRLAIGWAAISQLKGIMQMIELALEGGPYLKIVHLSGSCYPIKDTGTIYRYFAEDPEREHIRYFNMLTSNDHYRSLIFRKWFKEPNYRGGNTALRYADKGIRRVLTALKLPNRWDTSVVPHFGSNWFGLTPACAQYVIDYAAAHPAYWDMNHYTFSPDEHFIHTIVANSRFDKKADGLQPFTGRGTYKMANFHIIHPSLSKWYTEADMDELRQTDKLFVRKVNSATGALLRDRLDQFKDNLIHREKTDS